MMEEEAILINIATILAKDIILDKDRKSKMKKSIMFPAMQFNNFILDDSDDGLDLLIYDMQRKGEFPSVDNEKSISVIDSSEEYESESFNRTSSKSPRQYRGRRQDVNLHLGEYFNAKEFEDNLHFKKLTFYKILRTLRAFIESHMRNINGINISEESFISLALWKLSTDEHYEEISRRFRVPLDVCHWTVKNFCNLISTNLQSFVKWPTGREKQNETIEKFNSTDMPGPKLPQLFGIVALRQIDIFFESQDEEASVILQVICTADQKLIDCHIEFTAAYSFNETPFAKRMLSSPENHYIPENCYLIGDKSFPLQTFLMRPFENPIDEKEKKFNAILEEKRAIMNSVLNKMQKRFHSLYALEAKNITEVKKIVETICALHNVYEANKDDYLIELSNFDNKRFVYHTADESNEDGRKRRYSLMESLNLGD